MALEGAFETGPSQSAEAVTAAQSVWRRPLAVGGVAIAITSIVTGGLVAWTLWPTVASSPVNRFEYAVPADQGFRRVGRPVLALSPDGRYFVYNTDKGLYLRTMEELEARLISGTEEDLASPFVSPDGQSVAYWASAGSQLKRIAISGGAPVKIADAANPSGASWEADGTILFGQPKGIVRVSANGSSPEVVILAKENEAMYGPSYFRTATRCSSA